MKIPLDCLDSFGLKWVLLSSAVCFSAYMYISGDWATDVLTDTVGTDGLLSELVGMAGADVLSVRWDWWSGPLRLDWWRSEWWGLPNPGTLRWLVEVHDFAWWSLELTQLKQMFFLETNCLLCSTDLDLNWKHHNGRVDDFGNSMHLIVLMTFLAAIWVALGLLSWGCWYSFQ